MSEPIPLKVFRPRANTYYAGLDGVFSASSPADQTYISRVIVKRLMQLALYCSKYKKQLMLIINTSAVPDYVVSYAATLGIPITCVVSSHNDYVTGDYYYVENPSKFLADTTSVVYVLKPKGADYNLETEREVDLEELEYPIKKVQPSTLTKDPNSVVVKYKVKMKPNSDPYGVFDLGEQGERIPNDYYNQMIEQMPQKAEPPKPLRK